MKNYRGLFVTDLDGTLTARPGKICPESRAAIAALESQNVLRAIATGRSLRGTLSVVPEDFPIEYLVFSSGAGVVNWKTRELLQSTNLTAAEIVRVRTLLHELRLDYMVQNAIPENHGFRYFSHGQATGDFALRCLRHAEVASPVGEAEALAEASQFLLVVPPERAEAVLATLETRLAPLSIIRATSPLDGVSAWLEIFPAHVSKAAACQWLADRYGLDRGRALAVGNDYNDLKLLRWAGSPFVVANSPPELLREFASVGPSDQAGVAQAIKKWTLSPAR